MSTQPPTFPPNGYQPGSGQRYGQPVYAGQQPAAGQQPEGQQGYGPQGYGPGRGLPYQQQQPAAQQQQPAAQQAVPQQQFLRQFGQRGQQFPPPPTGRDRWRLVALAVLVVVLALGAVVAIVASSADGEKTRASPSTPANIPVAPPVTTVAPTTTVAIAAGPTAADLMPLVLADSDVPFSWQEATDKENDDDSTTDADKVSGETPECTAALRQYVTPSAEKALVKVKTVFARTGSHGGPSVKTVAEADSLAKATSDFAAEMATYERCPTVIYDGTRITYTPIPGLPVVGDEILGYKVVAITASGGQAKGLEYVARSGSKAWTFEYNANVNDYVDSEANMLYTKALAKWTAGIK